LGEESEEVSFEGEGLGGVEAMRGIEVEGEGMFGCRVGGEGVGEGEEAVIEVKGEGERSGSARRSEGEGGVEEVRGLAGKGLGEAVLGGGFEGEGGGEVSREDGGEAAVIEAGMGGDSGGVGVGAFGMGGLV
jgi:hypothetical protein